MGWVGGSMQRKWRGTPSREGLQGSEALRVKQRSGAKETGWKGS